MNLAVTPATAAFLFPLPLQGQHPMVGGDVHMVFANLRQFRPPVKGLIRFTDVDGGKPLRRDHVFLARDLSRIGVGEEASEPFRDPFSFS